MTFVDKPNPRGIETQPQNSELQNIVNIHAEWLRSMCKRMGLQGFNVESAIHSVVASSFQDKLTLGIGTEFAPDKFALFMAGSKQPEIEGKKEIIPMLLLPRDEGTAVLKDPKSKAIFTDGFWVCQDKTIRYMKPDKPLALDGLITLQDQVPYRGSESFLDTNERLDPVTINKQHTKEILTNAGVLVAPGIFIEHTDSTDVHQKFTHLNKAFDISDGIVVKDNCGDYGSGVKLFQPTELDKAEAYTKQLMEEGKDVVVEKRIVPMAPVKTRRLQNEFKIDSPDHNTRTLVTLSPQDPHTIDAIERIKEMSGDPVNVSKGAIALRLDEIYTPSIREKIYRTAEAATKAVCREIAKSQNEVMMGFARIDTIVDKNGDVYVLEVNAGLVGGTEGLTQLDKQPLTSSGQIFYPYTRAFLEPNYKKRKNKTPLHLDRVPSIVQDRLNLMKLFLRETNLAQATKVLSYQDSPIPAKYADFVQYLVEGFKVNNCPEEAEKLNKLLQS